MIWVRFYIALSQIWHVPISAAMVAGAAGPGISSEPVRGAGSGSPPVGPELAQLA